MLFNTNNKGFLQVYNIGIDGPVFVKHFMGEDLVARVIDPGDFVMLINLYEYVIENDIYNSFINPHGKRKE